MADGKPRVAKNTFRDDFLNNPLFEKIRKK